MIDKNFLKEYFLKPLCYAAVIVLVLYLLNKFTYFNFSVGSNNSYNSFEVIGVGKVTVIPDIATTTFTVTEKGKTQEAARSAANAKQNQAVTALEKIGIAKEDIKTTGFYVNPNYEDTVIQLDAPQSINTIRPLKPAQNGNIANITTQVKAKDITDMNKAIDALTEIGLSVSGVEYTQADQEKYVMEAQSKAIQDAKVQAKYLAEAACMCAMASVAGECMLRFPSIICRLSRRRTLTICDAACFIFPTSIVSGNNSW